MVGGFFQDKLIKFLLGVHVILVRTYTYVLLGSIQLFPIGMRLNILRNTLGIHAHNLEDKMIFIGENKL